MEPHVAAKILIEQCDALMTYFMAPIHHDLLSRYIENDFHDSYNAHLHTMALQPQQQDHTTSL